MCDNWRSVGMVLADMGLVSAESGRLGGCGGSARSRPSADAPGDRAHRGFRNGGEECAARNLVLICVDGRRVHHGTSPNA